MSTFLDGCFNQYFLTLIHSPRPNKLNKVRVNGYQKKKENVTLDRFFFSYRMMQKALCHFIKASFEIKQSIRI